MVENRKLFYAISLMLLTCCQIITMLPHNVRVANSEMAATTTTTTTNLSNSNNNNENKNAKLLQETKNSNSRNNSDDSDFLIIAAERKQQKQQTIVTGEGVWEGEEHDSRPADNIDDLIFLDKRPINRHHQHQHHRHQHQHHRHHHGHNEQQHQHEEQLHQRHAPDHQQQDKSRNEQKPFELHHVTMASDNDDGGKSNSNSNSNNNSHSHSEEDDTDSLADTALIIVDDDDADDDDDAGDVDVADDGVPHEIELQPDINEEVTPLNVTPLDLSDFLSLIPATKVKTIVDHYYHNDPEVQRAHAFMSSRDFFMLKQHIIAVPEMSAFLHYLNNSGLDLVKFVTALTNLTSYENANTTNLNETPPTTTAAPQMEYTTAKVAERNDIENGQKQKDDELTNIQIQIPTTAPTEPTIDGWATTTATTTATEKEQLNGLHGLVDSVLDVLPQDQILATFFDKLEANEQFSKLVDNIGSPEFAKILNNMQNSMPLRNLIFTLHNNGIYVIRIVDSLKSYFFLGGF